MRKLNKEDIIEIVRLWDVPKIMEALDMGIAPEDLVNGKRADILLLSIQKQSEHIFLRIMQNPFNFKKNKFSYLESSIQVAGLENDYLYLKTLLSKMDDTDVQMRQVFNYNTYLHIACEKGLQKVALLLSKRGLNWEAVNNQKQTPLHILLRKVSFIEEELQKELKNVNINKKDNINLTCKDIITSCSFDEEWANKKENQALLQLFNIK